MENAERPDKLDEEQAPPAPSEPTAGEQPPEAPPPAEGEEAPVATDFRRNVWLLIIVIGVVVFAWVLSLLWKRVPEQVTELQQPGPRQPVARPRRPVPPPPRPTPVSISRVVGSEAEVIAASPALTLESGGAPYRLPRLFDVTRRLEGLDVDRLIRMPGQWADQRPVLDLEELPEPPFRNASSLTAVGPSDPVMLVTADGETRAYPVKSVGSFAGVRDTLAGVPVFLCHSPFTRLGRCLVARTDQGPIEWHDSGLIYRGNDVFYDATTGSLWDSLSGQVLTGPQAGARAPALPVVLTTWERLSSEQPEMLVLTVNLTLEGAAAERRRAAERALEVYLREPAPRFELEHFDPTQSPLPAKAFVLGVRIGGQARAYPLTSLHAAGVGVLEDRLGGRDVQVHVTSERTGYATADGETLDGLVMLWFGWLEANPQTDLYVLSGQAPGTGQAP
jgi:hypothetical protein